MDSNITDQYHLSPLQKRSWLMGSNNTSRYFKRCLVQVEGDLNIDLLLKSIQTVVKRHSILRTQYIKLAEFLYPFQSITETADFDFSYVDKSTAQLTIDNIKNDCPDLEQFFQNFNSAHTNPLFVRLFKLAEDSHALVIVLPSIAADSYSVKKIVDEIVASYYSQGNAEDEYIQYYHFSEWKNGVVELGNEEASHFWDNCHYVINNEISLSFAGRTQHTDDQFSFGIKDLNIGGLAVQKLKALALRLHVEASAIVAACFSALVKQHIRRDKFTMGFVNNTRAYEELSSVIGLLSQTLPVVIETSADTNIDQLARSINNGLEEVTVWDEYFTWGSNANDYATGLKPYFKIEFEFNDIKSAAQNIDTTFSIAHLICVNNSFDLKMSCLDLGDTMQIDFYYNKGILEADAIDVLAGQYEALLTAALDHIDCPVDNLPLRNDAEHIAILEKFNNFNLTDLPGNTVVELFEATVGRYPHIIAIRDKGVELSYHQLNVKVNRFARYLQQHYAFTAGSPVAIWLPRSAEFIIAMLAVLKAGACYLPVDSSFPVARVKFMLEDSGARVLITSETIEDIAIDQINYTGIEDKLQTYGTQNLNVRFEPGAPVYIIYTSGSTGQPKGVAISNLSLVNYFNWFVNATNLTGNHNTLLLSSVAYDLGYTSLWTGLLAGHTITVLPETEHPDPEQLIANLINHKIDYIKVTPSHFSFIINDPEFENNITKYSLKLIVIGGEEIRVNDVERYMHYHNDVHILHHYGPTETTIGTIALIVDNSNLQSFKCKPVLGYPITGNQVYILDNNTRLAPVGFTGEIAIAGKGVALGYLNRPELNSRKFIDNPFNPGSKIYLTGDLGRWQPDGTIEFLGRKDSQLKIRGFRVELGEIENVLLKHKDIKNASVLIKGNHNQTELVAFLLADEKTDTKSIKTFLSSFLPAYMVPDTFVWLNSLPLTPNGKVDKSALATLEIDVEAESSYISPKTSLERKMALIWREVLGKEKVGVADDFFKLGGHSLKATQLISRIFKGLGFKIKLSDIFENPTIQSLLSLVSKSGQSQYVDIPVIADDNTYAVSHAQKRLWFLDQLEEQQSAYNIHYAYWLSGSLHQEALALAFEMVIKRHESLRTTFIVVNGQPRQKVNKFEDSNFCFVFDDLRNEREPLDIAYQYSKNELNTTFSLSNGPLVKAALLQVENDKHAFLLTMHHIIADGWSMQLLFNEILVAYNANLKGQPEAFAGNLKIQYRDYAAWHNQIISGPDEVYWLNKLANPPGLVNLPYDKVPATEIDNDKPYPVYELGVETTSALKNLANEHNSSLSNIILTVYALFINKISGQADFLIGVGHANRNHADLEDLIGFFVNLLPVRIQLTEESTIESLIDDVTKTCIEAYDHSNYPFDFLVEKFCSDRYSTQQPLVNILYDFKRFGDLLSADENFADESGLLVAPMHNLKNPAKFDITLFAAETDNNLKYWFEYNSKCFNEQTINSFFKAFNELTSLILEKTVVEQG